jgi:hypothetical protein
MAILLGHLCWVNNCDYYTKQFRICLSKCAKDVPLIYWPEWKLSPYSAPLMRKSQGSHEHAIS